MTYPKRYLAPLNGPSEFSLKYRKWHILATLPTTILLCYIMAEKNVIPLLFGTYIITTFPYSFIFSLMVFGTLLWLLFMTVVENLHWQLSGTRPPFNELSILNAH